MCVLLGYCSREERGAGYRRMFSSTGTGCGVHQLLPYPGPCGMTQYNLRDFRQALECLLQNSALLSLTYDRPNIPIHCYCIVWEKSLSIHLFNHSTNAFLESLLWSRQSHNCHGVQHCWGKLVFDSPFPWWYVQRTEYQSKWSGRCNMGQILHLMAIVRTLNLTERDFLEHSVQQRDMIWLTFKRIILAALLRIDVGW